MKTRTITLNLPESANEKEVRLAIGAILFERDILSSSQAAEFCGISRKEFLESVGRFGVTIFSETGEDLRRPLRR